MSNPCPPARQPPLRTPPPLCPGDRVAFIAPSSHQGDAAPALRRQAAALLSRWDLRVVNAEEQEGRHLYLAGDDAARAAEFERRYLDPEIKALFLTRGGYGAARMLPLLNGKALAKAPPKLVVGFSDATSLFAYLHAVVGISVLHAPCIAAKGFLKSSPAPAELEALRKALFAPQEGPRFALRLCGGTGRELEGRVWGGNLSVLVTTMGTPWELRCVGEILFIEDVREAPYRIDRMLTHLRGAGKLTGLGALLLGHFDHCDGEPPGLLVQVWKDLFAAAPFPVLAGLPAGHGSPNLALPLGRKGQLRMEGERGTLQFV